MQPPPDFPPCGQPTPVQDERKSKYTRSYFNYQSSLLLSSILRRYLNALTISSILISVDHPWKRKPTHPVRVSGAEKRETVNNILKLMDEQDEHDFVNLYSLIDLIWWVKCRMIWFDDWFDEWISDSCISNDSRISNHCINYMLICSIVWRKMDLD